MIFLTPFSKSAPTDLFSKYFHFQSIVLHFLQPGSNAMGRSICSFLCLTSSCFKIFLSCVTSLSEWSTKVSQNNVLEDCTNMCNAFFQVAQNPAANLDYIFSLLIVGINETNIFPTTPVSHSYAQSIEDSTRRTHEYCIEMCGNILTTSALLNIV